MQTLKIALFCDGRPGHEKQSRGIVQALERYVDAAVATVNITPRSGLAAFGSHIGYLVHADRFMQSSLDPQTDLIVGTGSRTHVPMLSSARRTHARVVTCMTPPRHLLQDFDLCCVPFHDRSGSADNLFYTIGPPTVSAVSTEHDPDSGLALVGGVDDRSHVWDGEAVVKDLARMLACSGQKRWTIASSPRTPASTEDLIAVRLADDERVKFVPFRETEPGWLEKQYLTHAAVWVTADSISMVYEALSSGCRVGVLPVRWKKAGNKFQRSLDYLGEHKLIVSLEHYLQGAGLPETAEPLNEADRCAQEILKRWWPKNLP